MERLVLGQSRLRETIGKRLKHIPFGAEWHTRRIAMLLRELEHLSYRATLLAEKINATRAELAVAIEDSQRR